MRNISSQNVLDYPNTNTIFMVWVFNENDAVKAAFQRVCALMSNLNNSAQVRTVTSRASVVIGISHEPGKN